MKIKKSYIVLASLVVALSAAVYLNWQLSSGDKLISSGSTKELGAATYVSSDLSSSSDEQSVIAEQSNVTSTLTSAQSEYFAKSRSERQKAQDEVLSLAKEVLELTEATEEAKTEAVEQLNKIEDLILSQNRIETTLKAKGFSDCVCCISGESCTVIVPKNEMSSSAALIISDCVDDVTNISFENISIVEV